MASVLPARARYVPIPVVSIPVCACFAKPVRLMRGRLPRLKWGGPTHCILSFFECCCPCEPTSISILPMILAWCCHYTYLYCYIPTMSHPSRRLKDSKVRYSWPLLAPVVLFSLAHICGLGRWFFSAWSVICCQDSCCVVRQRHIARRGSQSQFWRTLLKGH